MSLPCTNGINQFNLLEKKIQSFTLVITEQLEENELSYIQFTDTVNRIYFDVLEKLQAYYLILTSIETINGHQLTVEKEKHKLLSKPLQQRLYLWKFQMDSAEKLLLQNEQKLTDLDFITSKIANIYVNGRETVIPEVASSQLENDLQC